ncbi:MAG: lectin like domain-containing protein [bacterium]
MKIWMGTAFADEPQLTLAPLNPEFEEYICQIQIKGKPSLVTKEGYYLGLVPSPVDMSHTKGLRVFPQKLLSYPSSYDLRTSGRLPPVKAQGNCGSCWAFATYGSLESWLLSQSSPETWNFSENNLKNTHGFDLAHDEGGNLLMSTAYFARWSGPIAETDDPYNPYSGSSPSGLKEKKHLETVLMIPDRASSLDNNNIKQAVMDYGAMSTSMYWDSSYYNSNYYAYYYNGIQSGNHAVDIVGWNDNFDKNKFKTTPSNNGAWIVRNSWGTDWGESGYFYISYYDKNIGKYNASFINAQEPASTNYQYDPLGLVNYLGGGYTWAANIFLPAKSGEELTSVGLYAATANTTYTIYIYNTFSGGSFSGLLGSKTGSLACPGYHTVHLDSSIKLTCGDNFAIAIKFTTPGFNKPIPIEYPESGYSSAATATAGQSYISSNGTNWTDITTLYSNTNVCIKGIAHLPTTATIFLYKSSDKNSVAKGGTITYTITYTNKGNGIATDVNIVEVLPEHTVLKDFGDQGSGVRYWYSNSWQPNFSEFATKIKWLIPQVTPSASGTVSFTCEVR